MSDDTDYSGVPDEPPSIPDPPMHEEWEDVETWSKANLRYPVPGGWDIADHGKFHTKWEHQDGTALTRTSKRTPGPKDTFVFTIDGTEVHSVETGADRSELREATVWLLTFYDDREGVESVAELQQAMREAQNQSLDAFAGGDE
ncbi:hypothetical protein [Halostella litorea]|uniref:hypothetical protein n=1 Tax=Halostella litorea TaxID=2528831 RepID=UPI001091C051|nr:hypothetical protein [Halostella litorea]